MNAKISMRKVDNLSIFLGFFFKYALLIYRFSVRYLNTSHSLARKYIKELLNTRGFSLNFAKFSKEILYRTLPSSLIKLMQLNYVQQHLLTPSRMAGVVKKFPYQFSPVTSANVRIVPQNFLTFSFNSFDRVV